MAALEDPQAALHGAQMGKEGPIGAGGERRDAQLHPEERAMADGQLLLPVLVLVLVLRLLDRATPRPALRLLGHGGRADPDPAGAAHRQVAPRLGAAAG